MIDRRWFLRRGAAALGTLTIPGRSLASGERLVALTFDDGPKAWLTTVAPLLAELGLGATFFATHTWMADDARFMSWANFAELHRRGFEIGSHPWVHTDLSMPRNSARLKGDLTLVAWELNEVGVPRPVSFAASGDAFGPEVRPVLEEEGYRFARRGLAPEAGSGDRGAGALYDPRRHHRLLIPTAADVGPDWTLERFRTVVERAGEGKVVVLRFRGAPGSRGIETPFSPERLRQFFQYLRAHGFKAVALRDLDSRIGRAAPDDPLLSERVPKPKGGRLLLPVEVEATRADLRYWLANMIGSHRYTPAEAAAVAGLTEAEVARRVAEWRIEPVRAASKLPRVLPYPGGRHPRIGYLEGAVSPCRGTKASIFLPWDPASYVVVDVPEVIFSNLGLLYLAHSYYPTHWERENLVIENRDWDRSRGAGLTTKWALPGMAFYATAAPVEDRVEMTVSLYNGTKQPLTGLETQICVMLKGAPGFNAQTNDNKIFRSHAGAIKAAGQDRYILSWWERPKRAVSGAPRSPCVNLHPVLPDCAPGETVAVRGRLWFYEGRDVERELRRY